MAATGRHEVPLPFVHEHAARQEPPGKFARFARMQDQGGPGVHFVIGYPAKGGGRVQSIRFDTMRYDVKQARAWLRKHGFKATGLEAAKPRRNPAMRTKTVRPRGVGAYFERYNRGKSTEYAIDVLSYRVVDGAWVDDVQIRVTVNGRKVGEEDDAWDYAVAVAGDEVEERAAADARARGLIE